MNRNSQDCKGYMAVEITFCLVIALKFGDLYRAYPALLGNSRHLKKSVLQTVIQLQRVAHVLLPLAVEKSATGKPERKVCSLPLLALDSATFGMLALRSRLLSQVPIFLTTIQDRCLSP